MKYQVRVTLADGSKAILIHRDRTSWGKRTARKHQQDFMRAFGLLCTLEEA